MRLRPALMTCWIALSLLPRPSPACTNYLVSRGASADGSTFISYSADSHTLYGELYHVPARDHLPGEMLDIYEWDTGTYVGKIKQVGHTYATVGNMNEHQVSIGETTFGGRPELVDPTGGIDYGQLMYVALQRARSAREAIRVMTSLAEEYGFKSEGESFSVADPDEVWILEMVGRGPGGKGALWVARRVPDGYVSAHANQARIRTFPRNDPQNCMYARDVVKFARERGWFSGKDEDFSFADTYAPLTCEALRFCEARVWAFFRRVAPSLKLSSDYVRCVDGAQPLPLWIKPDRKLSVRDVMELMRDHFEGTELDLGKGIGAGPYRLPYRWRPLTWEVDGVTYLNERATSTQQTGFSFVAQARRGLPDPIGGVLWFGVDDTFSTVYVPMYCGILSPPLNYAVGTGDFRHFSWESAFWVFNWVANFAYSRYSEMIEDIRRVQAELEGDFLAQQGAVEEKAKMLLRESERSAREFLTQYSSQQAARTVSRWRKLGEELLVKYLDGNLKDEHGNVSHPGYPEEWYRLIAAEAKDALKLTKLKGEITPEETLGGSGFFHSRDELREKAKNVPADFPFEREKLLLVPGKDRCGRPPQCCLSPKPSGDGKKLSVEIPKAPKDPCGAPDWLLRLPRDERRPVIRGVAGH